MTELQERPTNYYVLSDSHGFVGAFYSAAEVAAEVHKYYMVPFITQLFPVAPGPVEKIWVILYRDIDAVAFVTNSRTEAEQVQKIYNSVGLTYIDSVDYWEQSANKIIPSAAERLNSLDRAHKMYATVATQEEIEQHEFEDFERITKMGQSRTDGPMSRIIQENEKITIFNCVVPIQVGGEFVDCNPDTKK